MSKEKTLSDKIADGDAMYNVSNTEAKCVFIEDIKDFIKKFKEKIKINGNLHTESCDECNKIKRTNRHENMIFEIMDELVGEKFK